MRNKLPILDIHTLLWVRDMINNKPINDAIKIIADALEHAEDVQESWLQNEPPRFGYEDEINLNRQGIKIVKEDNNEVE